MHFDVPFFCALGHGSIFLILFNILCAFSWQQKILPVLIRHQHVYQICNSCSKTAWTIGAKLENQNRSVQPMFHNVIALLSNAFICVEWHYSMKNFMVFFFNTVLFSTLEKGWYLRPHPNFYKHITSELFPSISLFPELNRSWKCARNWYAKFCDI